MDPTTLLGQRIQNAIQTLLLLIVLSGLMGYLAWVMAGPEAAWFALALVALLYLLAPRVSPRLVLRFYGAQPIHPQQAAQLYAILRGLAQRAGLPEVPRLFYLPSNVMNAFAVGEPDNAAVVLSDGLLRRLTLAESAGVLAHEVSHIRHNDIRVMGLADMIDRFTRILSLAGQALLLISLPLWIVGGVAISWLTIAILLLAPTISALAQLALSRTREYNADLEAARLLGDPEPLALALAKIERFQGRLLEQFLGPGQRLPDPSMLRSHPSTEERIRRLVALRGHADYLGSRLPSLVLGAGQAHGAFPLAPHPLRPRWHGLGTWY